MAGGTWGRARTGGLRYARSVRCMDSLSGCPIALLRFFFAFAAGGRLAREQWTRIRIRPEHCTICRLTTASQEGHCTSLTEFQMSESRKVASLGQGLLSPYQAMNLVPDDAPENQ